MTEYIEREALIDKILSEPPDAHYPSWFADIIKKQPTADVVPRAEVENLIYKLECLLCHVTGGRLSKHTYDLRTMETVATDCINETYNDGYGEGYKEAAWEIFAEIENKFFGQIDEDSGEGILCIYAQDYYEDIKKKYTEETT